MQYIFSSWLQYIQEGKKSWTYFLSASIPSCRLISKGVIVIGDILEVLEGALLL